MRTRAAGLPAAPQTITPKIDLSHVSKPGDVMKAILAKKQEEEAEARKSHVPARARSASRIECSSKAGAPRSGCRSTACCCSRAAGAAQDRAAAAPRAAIIPPAPPAIASRPPAGAVVAKAPVAAATARPVVAVVPPAAVVKPPATAVPPQNGHSAINLRAAAPKPPLRLRPFRRSLSLPRLLKSPAAAPVMRSCASA